VAAITPFMVFSSKCASSVWVQTTPASLNTA